MSVQSRTYSAPQLSPGNFVRPAPPPPPPGPSPQPGSAGSLTLNFVSPSSSAIFHRNPPRDPFTLSAPPVTTVSTLPGFGGLFLSPSVNSHTGFVPSKVGVSKTEAPVMKPPKPPEKPLMPYMRYSRRMWEKVRLSNPDSKLWDIGKIIGQMWRELPDSSRQVYIDEYETEKQEYDKAMKAYHNSPAYQAYLMSKNRSRGSEKPSGGTSESGVYITPAEEEEGEGGQYSIKQLTASRFHRNHRLMKEIFGETQVPDARNVITAQRLSVLKKQVNSLTLHQNKLEEELKQLEAKFEAKKRKMDESSVQFAATLKKICSQKIDPFEELVERSKTNLLNAYEQYKVQEQKQREALLNESSRTQPAEPMEQQAPSSSVSNGEPHANSETETDQTKQNQDISDAPTELEKKNGEKDASVADAISEVASLDSSQLSVDNDSSSKKAEQESESVAEAEASQADGVSEGGKEEKDPKSTPIESDKEKDTNDDGKDSSEDSPAMDDGSENLQEA